MRDPVSDNYILYRNIDPLEMNGRKPYVTQDYNASISGGNDRGRYYASLGLYDADGFIKGTFYKRYNFALTGSYKITKWYTGVRVVAHHCRGFSHLIYKR